MIRTTDRPVSCRLLFAVLCFSSFLHWPQPRTRFQFPHEYYIMIIYLLDIMNAIYTIIKIIIIEMISPIVIYIYIYTAFHYNIIITCNFFSVWTHIQLPFHVLHNFHVYYVLFIHLYCIYIYERLVKFLGSIAAAWFSVNLWSLPPNWPNRLDRVVDRRAKKYYSFAYQPKPKQAERNFVICINLVYLYIIYIRKFIIIIHSCCVIREPNLRRSLRWRW